MGGILVPGCSHLIEMLIESPAQKMGKVVRPALITIRSAIMILVVHRLSTDVVNDLRMVAWIPRSM